MSHHTDQNEGNPILSDLGATEFFLSLASMQLVDALTVSMRAISEKEDPSGFELYAKRLISHIDLEKLREIDRGLGLPRPHRTHGRVLSQ